MAYGSNLLRRRFLAYLTGGSGPGGSGTHVGARDATPPQDDRPFTLDRRLIFTGRSTRWNGGGVCAVVPTDGRLGPAALGPAALGRGWLITAGQLIDVWRQENGGRRPEPFSWPNVIANGHCDMDEGRYRRLDWLGHVDGRPAVTITCDEQMLSHLNPPTLDYLVTVGRGLIESRTLTPSDAVDYLLAATDLRGRGQRDRLIADLSSTSVGGD